MGTVRISSWGGVDRGCAKDPLGVETLTTSGSNTLSGFLPTGAKVVSLYAVEDHYLSIGTAPDATATKRFFVPAGTERDVRLTGEATLLKVAAATV